MKILVISDSHGARRALQGVVSNEDYDRVVFLGDYCSDMETVKVKCSFPPAIVKGNCDFMHNKPEMIMTKFNGYKFLIVHGHKFNVETSMIALEKFAKINHCDCVLYGHTHIHRIYKKDNIWFINPGAFGKKDKESYERQTYALLTVDENGIKTEFKNMDYVSED
jgi:uncharacterized protein